MGAAEVSGSRRAVILLSGGMDSATTLAIARKDGYACYALSFDYGQRHKTELEAAVRVAEQLGVQQHRVYPLSPLLFGGSALTDISIAVPEVDSAADPVPVTYVPARNTVFLSLALAWAETLGARDIFIGANAVDYSGYPDCRPEFLAAFEAAANLGTRVGTDTAGIRIRAPLVDRSKEDIIRCGDSLGVDYALTVSCYRADNDGRACRRCAACQLRARGFLRAGIPDPTPYI